MKTVFARHGIPTSLIADNMPFNSKLFRQFATEWNFNVVTSGPHYSQSNGFTERNVQTTKICFKKLKKQTVMNILIF